MKDPEKEWFSLSDLENMVPIRISYDYWQDKLKKLIEKHREGPHVKGLGIKSGTFNQHFVDLWKVETDLMQNFLEVLYPDCEDWIPISDVPKMLLPIKGRNMGEGKLNEILSYCNVREKHPYLFRLSYTGKTYPSNRGEFVLRVHRHAAKVINKYVIDYMEENLDKSKSLQGMVHGRGWKTPPKPRLDQLDRDFS